MPNILLGAGGPSALYNFATLQTAVLSDVKRTGDVTLTAELPRFVQMAEFEIFRDLQLRSIESLVTGVTSGATIPLPVGVNIERISITARGRDYSLDYTSPNDLSKLYHTNQPTRYTVEGGLIKLLAPPNSTYSYTLYTIPNLTPLSPSNPTNWLITNAPDVYLYGTLLQTAMWMRDTEAMGIYKPMFDRALDSVRRSDAAFRLPLSGGLQIKPRGIR